MYNQFDELNAKIETLNHILCIYDTDMDFYSILSHQFSKGLEKEERLFYISHKAKTRSLKNLKNNIEIDLADSLNKGQLEIISWQEFYISKETYDIDALIDMLKKELGIDHTTIQLEDEGYPKAVSEH